MRLSPEPALTSREITGILFRFAPTPANKTSLEFEATKKRGGG